MATTSLQVRTIDNAVAVVDTGNPFSKATFDEWIKFCDVQPATQKTYNKAVENFAGYLARNAIEYPVKEDIENYREDLLSKGFKVSSVRLYMTVVKTFFRYLSSKMIYPNVTDHVKLPALETDEHARDALTLVEARQALNSFKGTDEKTLRDKCIMGLMIGCGLRSVEIIRLDIGDTEKRRGQWFIKIHGKGKRGKTQNVQISLELKKMIDEYLSVRPKGKKGTALFISTAIRNRGQRLQTQTISRLAKKVFKNIGIESDRISCHSCRHTCATLLLEAGVDIRKVQRVLRHRSATTTEIYSHDIDKFKNNSVQILSNLLFTKE